VKAKGGKSIYGASVGILMLEAQFPRIAGDMGNALTWPFPVHYKVVRDASPDRVVRHGASGLFDSFLNAARELVEDGVDGITTNCGFLALFQDELSKALNVPVATSSLMQVPMVERLLPPGKRAGILTISSATLSKQHLEKAGCALDTPIAGTPERGEFTSAILGNRLELDVAKARQENIEAALALKNAHPEIGAIVLECTNMVPYAADISAVTGLPVFSIYNFICWFQSGLLPREFRNMKE
jgi:Asp/Glu/hydantoin racemase